MSLYISSFRRYTIAVFLMVPLIVGLAAVAAIPATEMLIRARVIPNDRFLWHLDLFLSRQNENVVLGDSYTSSGVHGLPGFLNLSYPADSIPTIETKVRSYFAEKQPGKVILEADPYMFSPHREQMKPLYDVHQFGKNRRFRLWMFTALHRNNIIKYWELYFQRAPFHNQYTFQPDGALTKKRSWLEWAPDTRLDWASKSVDPINWPVQAPGATEYGRSYQRILAFLTSRGAQVCMVDMPLAPLVRASIENSPDDPRFRRGQDYYQALAPKYGAAYVDMSSVVNDDLYFLDALHLNEAGALEFAPLLEAACFGSSPSN